MICLSLNVGSRGLDIGGEIPAWRVNAADSHGLCLPFPSNLVTHRASRARFPQPIHGLAARSPLVTVNHRISQSDQRIAPLSSLVTVRHLRPVIAHIRAVSPATPGLDLRARHRGSSLGSQAFVASAVGSPSCSPPGRPGRNKIFAGFASADGGETGAGSAGIDVVFSLSRGLRILLARMMPALPGTPRHRGSRELIITDSILSTIPARHRDHNSGSLRKLSTIRPCVRPRSSGTSVHDALESLSFMSRNNQSSFRQRRSCADCRVGSSENQKIRQKRKLVQPGRLPIDPCR
jgi:hypothetical protein